MERTEAKALWVQLVNELNYHNEKYYTEDAPEIDDYEYDMMYRRLQQLEAEYPELVYAGFADTEGRRVRHE